MVASGLFPLAVIYKCSSGWLSECYHIMYCTGASMCKFPYSILMVYYSNLIIYSVILVYIIEYYRYITDVIVMM